jgi:lysophospholipase L1-like esterase
MLKCAALVTLLGVLTASAETTNVVVMLGDSTTLCRANKPGSKLTELVQAQLETTHHLPALVINSGVGGDTAKGGLARLQTAVLVHKPDVVTVSFGLNDTGKLTPGEYRAAMEQIVLSLQTNTHAGILLVTSTPFNSERHAWKEQFRDKGGLDPYMDTNICAAQRELAKKYNLTLCDLHAHFSDQFRKNPKLIDVLLLPDGVHLTDKGNEAAASYVAPFIAQLLARRKAGN